MVNPYDSSEGDLIPPTGNGWTFGRLVAAGFLLGLAIVAGLFVFYRLYR